MSACSNSRAVSRSRLFAATRRQARKRRAFMGRAIRNRTGAHGRGEPPRDPAAAWTWRSSTTNSTAARAFHSKALQSKSDKFREQLRRATVGLIDKRAWSAQARRTSARQRQALVGWLDTIRRIGKGHGIRVWTSSR